MADVRFLGTNMPHDGILKAIEDIGFHGFANLETDSPSHVVEQDMGKNLRYIRRLMG